MLSDGGVNLYYKWDAPFEGHCCDEMRLHGPDQMHVTTHLTVGEESCSYRVVYWRAGSSGNGGEQELPPTTAPPPQIASFPLPMEATTTASPLLASLIRSASKVALQVRGFPGGIAGESVVAQA